MSAQDFYCEYCEDNKYIEVSEGHWIPCPHCNCRPDERENEYED